MERETLSNNTEYQKRLREARIKVPVPVQEARLRMRLIGLDTERRKLQQQVSVTIGQI